MNGGELMQVRSISSDPAIAIWHNPNLWRDGDLLGYVSYPDFLVYTGQATRVEGTTFIRVLTKVGIGWVVRDVVREALTL